MLACSKQVTKKLVENWRFAPLNSVGAQLYVHMVTVDRTRSKYIVAFVASHDRVAILPTCLKPKSNLKFQFLNPREPGIFFANDVNTWTT